jgi:replication-associated recombination protein RarA
LQHQTVYRSSKPLLSRFTIFEIPEYTYEEFETISIRIVSKLPQNIKVQIASSIWKSGNRDIRDILNIAKLINAEDTDEDIKRLISIHQLPNQNPQCCGSLSHYRDVACY